MGRLWRSGSADGAEANRSEGDWAGDTPGFYLRRADTAVRGAPTPSTANRARTDRVAAGGLHATASGADGALRATAWGRPARRGRPAGTHHAARRPEDRRPAHRAPVRDPHPAGRPYQGDIRHSLEDRTVHLARPGRTAGRLHRGHTIWHLANNRVEGGHLADRHPAGRHPAGRHLADRHRVGTLLADTPLGGDDPSGIPAPAGARHRHQARRPMAVRREPSPGVHRRSRHRHPRPADAIPGAAARAPRGRGARPGAAPAPVRRSARHTLQAATPAPAGWQGEARLKGGQSVACHDSRHAGHSEGTRPGNRCNNQ